MKLGIQFSFLAAWLFVAVTAAAGNPNIVEPLKMPGSSYYTGSNIIEPIVLPPDPPGLWRARHAAMASVLAKKLRLDPSAIRYDSDILNSDGFAYGGYYAGPYICRRESLQVPFINCFDQNGSEVAGMTRKEIHQAFRRGTDAFSKEVLGK